MTLSRKLAMLSFLLELAGIILLAFVLVSFAIERNAAAQPVMPAAKTISVAYAEQTVHGIPTSISVPSLGIEATIDSGYYDQNTGRWLITEEAAYYATITDEVNNTSGSTFIYGHNSDKIFGKLRQIKSGATAAVKTSNGYEFTYKLTEVENVSPTNTQMLEYKGKPRIVLQTCSGFWNETRQLTYFDFVSYKKSS